MVVDEAFFDKLDKVVKSPAFDDIIVPIRSYPVIKLLI